MSKMNPAGCLALIQFDLRKLRQKRRIDAFQAYLRSPRFRELFANLPPERIEVAITAVAAARKACKLPAAPKKIGTGQIAWDVARKAHLGRAYAKFGPKAHVAVAAEMGLTIGQVRLAKRRFLDARPVGLKIAA